MPGTMRAMTGSWVLPGIPEAAKPLPSRWWSPMKNISGEGQANMPAWPFMNIFATERPATAKPPENGCRRPDWNPPMTVIKNKVFGIIPARYGSTRFPGKPLALILGKPMFWHVFQRASLCPELEGVVLATDSRRIAAAAETHDVPVVMTRPEHPSGTDRVLEAADHLELPETAVVINIQGDEPALHPEMLSELVRPFAADEVQVATLISAMDPAQRADRDQVKVVIDHKGDALYFSRAVIPHPRDEAPAAYFRHIGLYAFRMAALRRFVALGPGRLERTEKLEQLRLLENGIPIRTVPTRHRSPGVDRPEDVARVSRWLTSHTKDETL